MMRLRAGWTAGFLLCAVAAVAAGQDTEQPGKLTVKAVSLRMNHAFDKEVAPLGSTELLFEVACPGKHFLSIMDSSSKISEFTDDKGTDLLRAGKPGRPHLARHGSSDPSGMVFSFTTPNTPARGALKLRLKGKLVLFCGAAAKSSEARDVEFKPGKQQVKFGDLAVVVDSPLTGSGAFLRISSPRPIVKSVTIKGADSQAVELLPRYHVSGRTWTATCMLKKRPKKGKVSITWFTREEKLTVPVDLNLGVGL